ncbi:FUSC family protein [Enterococcus sp. DIV0660C]|uniref:FUSC family protein n=1 Tax=Enterococcus sp. DIV0660C TaxID=2230880 RepID=UPI001A8CA675|nr:FUSC family protein [Enterococcus sp. DIV0660C]MBO0430752.1 FUSC family protein [Enterococcus sp. DIV0660C]
MTFYQLLQLDPLILKQKIKNTKSSSKRRKYFLSLVLRSLLIVGSAICVIVTSTKFFGESNKPYAIVFFCMMLSLRFVDFGYKFTQSILGLGIVLGALFVAPFVHLLPYFILQVLLHFFLLGGILIATLSDPKMGNPSLYGFSYIFVVYSTITEHITKQLLNGRLLFFGLFYLIFLWIIYHNHRNKHKEKTMFKALKEKSDSLKIWLCSYVIFISLLLAISQYLSFERFMWFGFAFSSLFASYGFSIIDLNTRATDRLLGTIIGMFSFILLSMYLPIEILSLLGGICLGFCSSYRYKTVFNCIGALTIASQMYGIPQTLVMRFTYNLLGVSLAVLGILFVKMLINHRDIIKETN